MSIGDFGSVACFYTDVSKIDVDSSHEAKSLHRIAIPKVLSTGENVRELEVGAKRVVDVVSGGEVEVVQVAHLDIVAVEEGDAAGTEVVIHRKRERRDGSHGEVGVDLHSGAAVGLHVRHAGAGEPRVALPLAEGAAVVDGLDGKVDRLAVGVLERSAEANPDLW